MNQCHGHCAYDNAKRLGTSPTHVHTILILICNQLMSIDLSRSANENVPRKIYAPLYQEFSLH